MNTKHENKPLEGCGHFNIFKMNCVNIHTFRFQKLLLCFSFSFFFLVWRFVDLCCSCSTRGWLTLMSLKLFAYDLLVREA